MNKGKSEAGIEIKAKDAVRGTKYYCCFCNKSLILKRNKRIYFFSHKAHESCIRYDLDNSEWAIIKRNGFEAKDIEFALDYEGEKRLVDVNLKNHLAMMFSNTMLRKKTFDEKTIIALSQFSKLIWTFNMKPILEEKRIEVVGNNIYWKTPSKMFKDYSCDENVTIIAEVYDDSENDQKKAFAVFQYPNYIFNDKKIVVKRWLTREQYIQYYNDIAERKNPEEPYLEVERVEREKREEADREYAKKLEETAEKRRFAEEQQRIQMAKERQDQIEREIKQQEEQEEKARQQKQKEIAVAQRFMGRGIKKTIAEIYEERKPKNQLIVMRKGMYFEVERIVDGQAYGYRWCEGRQGSCELLEFCDQPEWSFFKFI